MRERWDIGRYLDKSSGSALGFFNRGTTVACLRRDGKTPEDRLVLIKRRRNGMIAERKVRLLKCLVGITSASVSVKFIELIVFSRSSVVTGWKDSKTDVAAGNSMSVLRSGGKEAVIEEILDSKKSMKRLDNSLAHEKDGSL